MAATSNELDHYRIDFIDPLFAGMVTLGFAEGVFREPWFQAWQMPKGNDWFELATFGLAFLTLLLSWVGYHESIIRKPLKGFARFILDVVLVVTYGLMLILYDDLPAVLGLLVLTYFLFALWDLAKIGEYGPMIRREREAETGSRSLSKLYHREFVTGIWFGWFALLWYGHHEAWFTRTWTLVLAFSGLCIYRLHKKWFVTDFLLGRFRAVGLGRKNEIS